MPTPEESKLTPLEVRDTWEHSVDKEIPFDHYPTPEDIMFARIKYVSDVASAKAIKWCLNRCEEEHSEHFNRRHIDCPVCIKEME